MKGILVLTVVLCALFSQVAFANELNDKFANNPERYFVVAAPDNYLDLESMKVIKEESPKYVIKVNYVTVDEKRKKTYIMKTEFFYDLDKKKIECSISGIEDYDTLQCLPMDPKKFDLVTKNPLAPVAYKSFEKLYGTEKAKAFIAYSENSTK